MRKFVLALAAVGAISAASIAPAEAYWVHRGWGPGIGFGLAAGAIALGAAAATAPYYYGPAYYGPAYYPRPYAYYGAPVYYGPRYYRGPYW